MTCSGISPSKCVCTTDHLCYVPFCFQLKDAGMLQSYSFSYSDLSSMLEMHKEEEFLSRFLSFMECLKVSALLSNVHCYFFDVKIGYLCNMVASYVCLINLQNAFTNLYCLTLS